MEKNQFYILLDNFTCLTREESLSILELEKVYPYSQVIHCMAARAAQLHNLSEKENLFHLAALSATDRILFKTIMTSPSQPRKELSSNPVEPTAAELTPPEDVLLVNNEESITNNTHTDVNNSFESLQNKVTTDYSTHTTSDNIYEEVIHDLDLLHHSMHQFEETVKKLEAGETVDVNKSAEKKRAKPVDPEEKLLNELSSVSKEYKPESANQIEQVEIIDQFIKTQPTIKGRVNPQSNSTPNDLAAKNDGYNENIISETLVQILLKQGKKDKAIDILKKLIWKFPQKKAYFAAQIEELKK